MQNNEIRKQMELEQKRAFCKQSCTKIDQGLAKLDPRSGERAIWELFQNARDNAKSDINGEKKAYIKITLTPSEFIFSHKGRPFDHDSLSSLVMQVSSHSKENDETVGQYGTGFLTTHAFGRKLYVNGSLDMSAYGSNSYADIDRFVIDRTYDDIKEFVDKVAKQLIAVTDYADAEKTMVCREWTELHYDLSSMEGAGEQAAFSIESAVKITPYVMTINKPIVSVILENQITGDIYQFEKKQLPDEVGLKVMQVSVMHNGVRKDQKIFYLESEDGEDIAILPLHTATEARSLKGIAKLFVFFPLLGTEEFGMDVIFHSQKFIPVEERDGLHLPVTNANVRAKYENNLRVLDSLTEMVCDYYRTHAESISNWDEIAGLTFDCEHHKEDVTKEFFRNYKERWSNFYQNLPMFDYNDSRVCIADSGIRLFAPEIVADIESDPEKGSSVLTTLYSAASTDMKLVSVAEILPWSSVVASWDLSHPSLVSLEDIAQVVSENDTISLNTLRDFDAYLVAKQRLSLFDTYTLIPNRNGVKMKKSTARDASTIPTWLSDMANGLVNDRVEDFADDAFAQLVELTSFSRNDLRDAITSKLRTLRQTFFDKGIPYEGSIVNTLLEFSSIFTSETAATVRRATTATVANHLNIEIHERILPALDSYEADLAELPFKHLVESMLLEISDKDSEWIASNMEYIHSLHTGLCNWAEYYNRNTKDGLCTKYGAFPNRNAVACMARDLEKGIDIPDDLASLYQAVMESDLNERLVDDRFGDFYEFSELNAKDVAGEIEEKLESDDFTHSAVLDIINRLNDGSEWNLWFPRIASRKAELFLGRVQEDCKEDIFKLMKIEDPQKLNKLAELADDEDLDVILELGRAALRSKIIKERDFKFKLALGKYVEEIINQLLRGSLPSAIKEHLENSLSNEKITVEADHYGCDLCVCKNGEPVYFIEVKSRWSNFNSVIMSPTQMHTSVKHADNYALCCVDMSNHVLESDKDIERLDINEILPNITSLPNIGSLNQEASEVTIYSEDQPVYIGGCYECVVPKSTILSQGIDFESLMSIILRKCGCHTEK